ncbi:general secretion pathway protein GspE [Corallococcus praedator]|uniref:General secretion pathway protein GspE n=1 Tax=Corallococcus praedator TaxID=2316724 RepID=A0ABX9QKI3_9BACT|nr:MULTISPECIES: general secretion pathway protein GspE [Corallococcus]RKH34640.1 general secretion pathway protein GspE [Corallococcus sp. CA031C]RKI10387.1 general secretion pathway protein GspE [Corallococcus praedator]
MRLGELLVKDGLVSAAALEEALESQVVHGGRLGTNLVELGLLSEPDLAKALGKLHNCAYASGEMVPDPKAVALVNPNEADDKEYLPMRSDATRLSVAVVNPHDFPTLDAIAFKTGKRVVPVVIPEFRMNQLLRRHAKAFRQLRAIDMNAVRPRPAKGAAAELAKAQERPPDLMSEEEFQSVYAQALGGADADDEAVLEGEIITGVEVVETPVPLAPVARPPEAPPPQARPAMPASVPAPPRPVAPPAVQRPVPPGVPPRVDIPAHVAPQVPVPGLPAQVAATGRPPAASPGLPVPPQVRAPTPPPTPMTFPEAQAELARSSDREDVARTVLRFALGKWRRSLLLSVQGNLVTGWHGMGQGVRDEAVRRIGVPLRDQSTFRLVRDTRSHYVGPVKRDAAMGMFYRLLGGGFPTTAVILPLLVRGKVVHLLYVDNGPDQLTPPDVGELLILSQSVGRSYEAMMRRRKSA